jgi:hypothetical protein
MQHFIVSIQISDQQTLYYAQAGDDYLLTPNRDKATRFPEERADMLAAAHNLYTLTEAQVEGAKAAPEAIAS